MSKPIIGISTSFSWQERQYTSAETYIESVKKAGGVPLLLPHIPDDAAQMASYLDGLIITGGPDIDSASYNEDPSPAIGGICPERDDSEFALVREFLATKKPLLGICRGEQLINIACGGSLYQDLNRQFPTDTIKHNQQGPRWYTSHKARVSEGTRLAAIFGEHEIEVNSFHHQAVKELALGLVVAAMAPDGVIEAYERPGERFLVGVQWHPECMFDRTTRSDKLFAAFIAACRG